MGWKLLGQSTSELATKSMNRVNYALGRSTNTKANVADPVARREARAHNQVSGWAAGASGQTAVLAEGRKGCDVEKRECKVLSSVVGVSVHVVPARHTRACSPWRSLNLKISQVDGCLSEPRNGRLSKGFGICRGKEQLLQE